MQSDRRTTRIVRFGSFEVDFGQRVLRKDGLPVKLQAQPFEILAALLEDPGATVTRAELRRRIWPDDTYVDFEHGLNAAVARLRQALDDSADKPRFIATLPKVGYRFCFEVDRQAESQPAVTQSEERPAHRKTSAVRIGAVAAILGMSVWLPQVQRTRGTGWPDFSRAVPVTSFPGQEMHPALSPDGSKVAFIWDGETRGSFDIYVLRIGTTTPVRLTFDAADEFCPAWSPDGDRVAFIRRKNSRTGELLLIPADGGPEHKISEITDQELREPLPRLLSLDWAPTGEWIAASHRASADPAERIYLFSVTGEARAASFQPGIFGDHTPAISPDGRMIVFSRLAGFSVSEVVLSRLAPDAQPIAEARRVTTNHTWSANPAWTRDGKQIVYLSALNPAGQQEIRIVSTNGSGTEYARPLNDRISDFSLGKVLVYSRETRDTNIMRARIPVANAAPVSGEPFIWSTWEDAKPRYSPDGRRIAFTSSRSGTSEVWVARSDGSNAVRLTSFGGPLVGWANWSPNGQWLIFHARPEGQADIFVMPAAGGAIKRLTSETADDLMPVYSSDGHWIYFSSTRSGREEIWRMPSDGGKATRLTSSGGIIPVLSPDGQRIFYLSDESNAIWSVSVDGGQPERILGPFDHFIKAFAVTRHGIYYPGPARSGFQRYIWFFDLATGKSRPVLSTREPFGISVSPDGEYIAVDQVDEMGSDLLLLDPMNTR